MALIDQQIIQALASIRDEGLAKCECGGKGVTWVCESCGVVGGNIYEEKGLEDSDVICGKCKSDEVDLDHTDCPKCAPMRELELPDHWHVMVPAGTSAFARQFTRCSICGLGEPTPNPDLTTHQHGSKLWIVHALDVLGLLDEFLNCPWLTPMDLLDGKLLVSAIGAWLQERGK